MTTDLSTTDLMLLNQWLSPAFPIGSFSYSHGLEQVLQDDPALNLEAWLRQTLLHGAGRNDAILLRAGYTGAVDEADALGRALAPSRERLAEASQQGAAFCRVLRGAFGIALADLIYPVALGAAARERTLPLTAVTAAYLQAFTANLIGCAQRLTKLGQTDAQRMIVDLAPLCVKLAEDTEHMGLDALGGAVWASDAASMRHELLHSRLFQT